MGKAEDTSPSLSWTATLVLQALVQGHGYGFEIMGVTELPSGSVYPLLRRLENQGLVQSSWEDQEGAHAEGRPARRYYQATEQGRAVTALAVRKIAAQQQALGFASGAGSSA